MHDAEPGVFGRLQNGTHEQVAYFADAASGLKAVVAIHDTTLGPALGGCRMFPYANEGDALADVLRLSRGMTLKAAISGLALGGGKAVILADPKRDKSPALWRAFGRGIERLCGRYITAEDVGTAQSDMEAVRAETRHVVGIPVSMGGSGDPSPITALGTFAGMRAAAEAAFGDPSLAGRRVAVQGCGHVGSHLVRLLVEAGAQVSVADVDAAAVRAVHEATGAAVLAPGDIARADCDIFAPCAMGGVLNADTIPGLRCRAIAGAANNQLADETVDGAALLARGIVYAPDFVINAGGLINVDHERRGYDRASARKQTLAIFDTTRDILAHARARSVPTFVAAHELAERRIAEARRSPAAPVEAARRPAATGRDDLRRVG